MHPASNRYTNKLYKDQGIDIATDRVGNCPILIMRLVDKYGKPYLLLSHIYPDTGKIFLFSLTHHDNICHKETLQPRVFHHKMRNAEAPLASKYVI